MDGVRLLAVARASGLVVMADGERLVIRGRKSAEALAQVLLSHKADVLHALAVENAVVLAVPDIQMQPVELDEDVIAPSCVQCGGFDLWHTLAETWRCQHCDRAAWERSRSLARLAARLREQSQRNSKKR